MDFPVEGLAISVFSFPRRSGVFDSTEGFSIYRRQRSSEAKGYDSRHFKSAPRLLVCGFHLKP